MDVRAIDLQMIHELDDVERHVAVPRTLAQPVPAHVGHDHDVSFCERLGDAILEPRSRRAAGTMNEDHRRPRRPEPRVVKLHAVGGRKVVVRYRLWLDVDHARQAAEHHEHEQRMAHGDPPVARILSLS